MTDKRTTNLFVGAAMLLLPAVLYTVLLAMNVWDAMFVSEPQGVFVTSAVVSLLIAGSLWFIGIVLLWRGFRSRALEKEKDRPKIIT